MKRHQTQTERDLAGIAAKRERESAPAEVWDNATDRYEGEELLAARERRAEQSPARRIALLETEHKELAKVVTETRVEVAGMSGKLDTMLDYAVKADAERERRSKADADALERRRKYVLALIGALGTAAALVIGALVGGCL